MGVQSYSLEFGISSLRLDGEHGQVHSLDLKPHGRGGVQESWGKEVLAKKDMIDRMPLARCRVRETC